jgi:putative component of membrane protein insertase Oxa1/YidC/SpoIIIJ protein YidD
MIRTLVIFFLLSGLLYSQTDWKRWDEQKVSYELNVQKKHDYSIDKSSFGMTLLSAARNLYYFFVSDLDGDNCAFNPSCSSFFIQAVKETSIFKGTLMFADRFTRDMNFFKGENNYPLLPTNKYFDPAFNYTLYTQKIKF